MRQTCHNGSNDNNQGRDRMWPNAAEELRPSGGLGLWRQTEVNHCSESKTTLSSGFTAAPLTLPRSGLTLFVTCYRIEGLHFSVKCAICDNYLKYFNMLHIFNVAFGIVNLYSNIQYYARCVDIKSKANYKVCLFWLVYEMQREQKTIPNQINIWSDIL